MSQTSVYHKMFKAYDMRGTFPELNEGVYYWTGYAFVQEILKAEKLPLKVNVVRDTRYTSPAFYKAICNGIQDAGGEVVPLGLGSTDFLYAACQLFDNPGMMVTASHNPKNDNGVKIVKMTPKVVGLESGLDKIRDFVLIKMEAINLEKLAQGFAEKEEDGVAKSKVIQFFEHKLQTIGSIKEVDLFLAQNDKKLKVVVDTGNGMGGWFMPNISGMYDNIEFIPLYWELDGEFPNHPADPLKAENVRDLRELVVSSGADLGVAFDGDADRAFFIDEKGDRIDGNFLVAVFAQTLIRQVQADSSCNFNPAAVYSVTGSRCLSDSINEVGGIAIPARQGHVYFKELMSQYRAIYGGEFTGHHYFGEFGCMDSGFGALVLFLKTMILKGATASQMFESFQKRYYLSEEMVLKIPEGQTFDSLRLKLKEAFAGAVSIHEVDGLAVFYPDWKFNLRPSNTEPVLRFLLECSQNSKEVNVDKMVAKVREVIGC